MERKNEAYVLYTSDLTDAEWERLAKFLPVAPKSGDIHSYLMWATLYVFGENRMSVGNVAIENGVAMEHGNEGIGRLYMKVDRNRNSIHT